MRRRHAEALAMLGLLLALGCIAFALITGRF